MTNFNDHGQSNVENLKCRLVLHQPVYMLFLTDIFMHVACILKFINHPDVSFYFPAAKVLHGKIGAIGFEQV